MAARLNYLYKLTGSALEARAAHYPHYPENKPFILTKESALLENKELFLGTYDLSKVSMWIILFPDFEDKFNEKLRQGYNLRNRFSRKFENFDGYLNFIVLEYKAWLDNMKSLKLEEEFNLRPKKKYFLNFFSMYNKLYYGNKKYQTMLRDYNYALNPLIEYWFDCQELEKTLKLPKFTVFLPYVESLKIFLTSEKTKTDAKA